ncbi:MAG: TolC family protein [Elusimicrobiales bacterium]
MRKAKLTKEMITEKALELFSEYGIDRVSMNDIAKELSITKPSLYYYFKNKEDIIFYAFSQKIGEMENILGHIDKKDGLKDFIYSLIETHYRFFTNNSTRIKCFFRVLDSENFKRLEGLINMVVNRIRVKIRKNLLSSATEDSVKRNIDEISIFISSIISYVMMEIKMKRKINMIRIKKVVDIFIKGLSVLMFFILVDLYSLEISEEKAISIAFEKNINIQNAITAQLIANEKVREYYGSSYPQINLSAVYTNNIEKPLAFMGSRMVEMGMRNSYSLNISLNQILWSGGKISSAISLAKIYKELSNQQIILSKNAVKKSVRQLFYTLLYMNEVVKLRSEMLSIEKQHLAMFEEKYKQGVASDLNLMRQKVEVSNREVDLIKAQNSYQITLLALKNLLGIDLDEDIIILGEFKYLERDFDFSKLYHHALINRPDWRIALLQRDMAIKTLDIDRASDYPTISLFANRQFSAANEKSNFPPQNLRGWSLVGGLSVNMPVFNGFSTTARIKQSQKNLEIAERNLEDMKRKLKIELRELELNMKEVCKRIEATKISLENADKILKSTEQRFKSGLASQLELNDATLLYSSARMNYINSIFDYINQLINLDYITGNYGGNNEK